MTHTIPIPKLLEATITDERSLTAVVRIIKARRIEANEDPITALTIDYFKWLTIISDGGWKSIYVTVDDIAVYPDMKTALATAP